MPFHLELSETLKNGRVTYQTVGGSSVEIYRNSLKHLKENSIPYPAKVSIKGEAFSDTREFIKFSFHAFPSKVMENVPQQNVGGTRTEEALDVGREKAGWPQPRHKQGTAAPGKASQENEWGGLRSRPGAAGLPKQQSVTLTKALLENMGGEPWTLWLQGNQGPDMDHCGLNQKKREALRGDGRPGNHRVVGELRPRPLQGGVSEADTWGISWGACFSRLRREDAKREP